MGHCGCPVASRVRRQPRTNRSSSPARGLEPRPKENDTIDNAIFGGTAGTVTVAVPVTVGNITFSSAGYVLNGGTLTPSPLGLQLRLERFQVPVPPDPTAVTLASQ